ncbi:kinase-like protein [Wallemia mellicola]|nr:kinase-like protein [Wallemia mellicola]
MPLFTNLPDSTQLSSPPASPAHRFISIHQAQQPQQPVSPRPAFLERRSSGVPLTPSSESYLPFPRTGSPAPAQAPSPLLTNAVINSPLALNATLSPPTTPSLSKRPLNPVTSSPRSSIASITSPTHRQSMALAVSLSLAGSVASSRCSSTSGQSRLSSRRSSFQNYNWSDQNARDYDENDDDDDVCDIFRLGDIFGEGYEFEGQTVRSVELGIHSQQRLTDRPKKMEVVKKLGTGSYAAVYAVKEVLEHDSDEDDLELSGVPTKTPARRQPRMFALKALSKKNLDDSQLDIQMYEARIHQSLPVHQNIVTLYHTLETSGWLFLLMEYCPGQDLYYWLQGRLDESSLDVEESDEEVTMSNEMTPSASTLAATPLARSQHSFMDKYLGGVGSKTPSTPSLLANVDTRNTMEGRARLRLISRMFESMCEAVAICHDNGISHRDIKPENFIVTDGVDIVELGDGRTKKERKVVCKLTDFGLSTFDQESSDFDCGSKSYMAFECRNNLNPTYKPKPADVWSLGIVLLNMLFKRNPWGEPNVEADESFDYYCQDPQMFLTGAFALTEPAAEYLAKNVLCEETNEHHRITAREFGRWARDLHKYVNLPNQPSPSVKPAVLSNGFTPLQIPSRPQSPVKLSRSQVLKNDLSEIAQTASPRANKVQTTLSNAVEFDPDLDDTLPSPLPMPERKLQDQSEADNMFEEATPRVNKSPNKSALLEFESNEEPTPMRSPISFKKNKPTKVQRETFEHTTTPTMATAWNSYGQRRDRIEKRHQAANQIGSTPPATKPGFRPMNTSAPAAGGITRDKPVEPKPVGVYRPPAARSKQQQEQGDRKVNNANAIANECVKPPIWRRNTSKLVDNRKANSRSNATLGRHNLVKRNRRYPTSRVVRRYAVNFHIESYVNTPYRPLLGNQQTKSTDTRAPIRQRIQQTRTDKERLIKEDRQQDNWRLVKRTNRLTNTNHQRLLNKSNKRRNQAGLSQG